MQIFYLIFFDSKRECNGVNLNQNAKELFKKLISQNTLIITSENIITTVIYALRKQKDALLIFANFLSDVKNLSEFAIVPFGGNAIELAANFYKEKGGDFEDILQYFCALENGCETIYTNDKNFPELHIHIKRTNPNLSDFIPQNV